MLPSEMHPKFRAYARQYRNYPTTEVEPANHTLRDYLDYDTESLLEYRNEENEYPGTYHDNVIAVVDTILAARECRAAGKPNESAESDVFNMLFGLGVTTCHTCCRNIVRFRASFPP
jgi:hypothetical protein